MKKEDDLFKEKYIFGSLFVLANNLQTLMDRQLLQYGLTSKQWLLLIVIEEFFKENSPTLKEAAEAMGTSHQNVKQIALKLEEKGFLSLTKDKVDGRVVRIELTRIESLLDETFEEEARNFLKTLFRVLTPEEIDAMFNIMDKFSHQLKQMGANNSYL